MMNDHGADRAARFARSVIEAAASSEVALEWMRLFAEEPNFRSAQASELVDETGGYRRPLRPEDWQWLKLVPSTSQNQSGLCALACNRMLACIYERATAVRGPRSSAPDQWTAFRAFYGERTTLLGELVRPFLESLLFRCWSDDAGPLAEWDGAPAALTQLFERQVEIERRRKATIDGSGWAASGLTSLVWLQHLVRGRGLSTAFRVALARGALSPSAARLVDELEASLRESAEYTGHGLSVVPNAHWQFYLPTTLSLVNHTHRLALAGHEPLALLGNLAASVILQRAFLSVNRSAARGSEREEPMARVVAAVTAAVEDLDGRYGKIALREIARGLDQAARVREANDRDIDLQVAWLRHFDEGRRFATSVDERIRQGELNLPKETFVEPLEMCSTTHIHDDHRLVVIESGRMVFWAMPNMRLVLAPGESLFVPKGRLHGSTIETAECVYHQPVLPDDIVFAGNSWLKS